MTKKISLKMFNCVLESALYAGEVDHYAAVCQYHLHLLEDCLAISDNGEMNIADVVYLVETNRCYEEQDVPEATEQISKGIDLILTLLKKM